MNQHDPLSISYAVLPGTMYRKNNARNKIFFINTTKAVARQASVIGGDATIPRQKDRHKHQKYGKSYIYFAL